MTCWRERKSRQVVSKGIMEEPTKAVAKAGDEASTYLGRLSDELNTVLNSMGSW